MKSVQCFLIAGLLIGCGASDDGFPGYGLGGGKASEGGAVDGVSHMVDTLRQIAANNDQVATTGSGIIWQSEFAFAVGEPSRLFVRGFKEVTQRLPSITNGFAIQGGTRYYALLFGNDFYGGLGQDSYVRILGIDSTMTWYALKTWTITEVQPEIKSAATSPEMPGWITHGHTMNPVELMNFWLEHPDLPSYLTTNPFADGVLGGP